MIATFPPCDAPNALDLSRKFSSSEFLNMVFARDDQLRGFVKYACGPKARVKVIAKSSVIRNEFVNHHLVLDQMQCAARVLFQHPIHRPDSTRPRSILYADGDNFFARKAAQTGYRKPSGKRSSLMALIPIMFGSARERSCFELPRLLRIGLDSRPSSEMERVYPNASSRHRRVSGLDRSMVTFVRGGFEHFEYILTPR